MPAPAARSLWLASALLLARALSGAGSPEPLSPRTIPARGALRLLHAQRLDVNREPAEVLELLPGIGPGRAAAIVAGRPYCELRELEHIRGIGPATRGKLAGFVAFPDLPRDCELQLRGEKH